MSFARFASEFVAAACREFILHRPLHLEFTRSGSGQYSFRVSVPPVGAVERERQAEVHYLPPPQGFYPPNPWQAWGGGGWPSYQGPVQQQVERQPPPPAPPPDAAKHPVLLIPTNWGS